MADTFRTHDHIILWKNKDGLNGQIVSSFHDVHKGLMYKVRLTSGEIVESKSKHFTKEYGSMKTVIHPKEVLLIWEDGNIIGSFDKPTSFKIEKILKERHRLKDIALKTPITFDSNKNERQILTYKFYNQDDSERISQIIISTTIKY